MQDLNNNSQQEALVFQDHNKEEQQQGLDDFKQNQINETTEEINLQNQVFATQTKQIFTLYNELYCKGMINENENRSLYNLIRAIYNEKFVKDMLHSKLEDEEEEKKQSDIDSSLDRKKVRNKNLNKTNIQILEQLNELKSKHNNLSAEEKKTVEQQAQLKKNEIGKQKDQYYAKIEQHNKANKSYLKYQNNNEIKYKEQLTQKRVTLKKEKEKEEEEINKILSKHNIQHNEVNNLFEKVKNYSNIIRVTDRNIYMLLIILMLKGDKIKQTKKRSKREILKGAFKRYLPCFFDFNATADNVDRGSKTKKIEKDIKNIQRELNLNASPMINTWLENNNKWRKNKRVFDQNLNDPWYNLTLNVPEKY